MYLLILGAVDPSTGAETFTFHNVSINSKATDSKESAGIVFTVHNVSINSVFATTRNQGKSNLHSIMYLLIPYATKQLQADPLPFTFHNVSINS